MSVSDGNFGTFTGTGHITFTGKGSPPSGASLFDVLLIANGTSVGELDGSTAVDFSGVQATIEFSSLDTFVAGPYTYQFQLAS